VLRRILGRQRNRVVLPDGRRSWPDISALWAAIPDVEQIQLRQRSVDQVGVRYAREQALSRAEEHASGERIHQALGYPFHLTFTRHDTIARQPNGKYETFFADIAGATELPGRAPL
jgi:phenylacetate-CoA ligase